MTDSNLVTINIKKLGKIGLCLIGFSFIFGLSETLYFGCNWYPQSPAELWCDGITRIICGAGEGLFVTAIIFKIIQKIKSLKTQP